MLADGSNSERWMPKVYAHTFLCKLRGSSQPSIIKGSDGNLYVVKFNGFPGHQGLINEAVGTGLIAKMGLPCPEWIPLSVSERFIFANRSLWFSRESSSPIAPKPGLHFASRLIGAEDSVGTYQLIPHSWIGRISNRKDFLGMLILDLWVNSCDRRQAVFLKCSSGDLHANFIDNDFFFGGKFGGDVTCPRRAMTYDLDMYKGLWNDRDVGRWLKKIDRIDNDFIRQMVARMPKSWAKPVVRDKIVVLLASRRVLLPRLIDEAKQISKTGYTVEFHQPVFAAAPPVQPRPAF